MIEVEIKLPVADFPKTKRDLEQLGFVRGKWVTESDLYFNSVWHDLKKGDEALRIRTCEDLISGNPRTVITYKGPKLDTVSMTRTELETEVMDASICEKILRALGFTMCYPVIKKRHYFSRIINQSGQPEPWEITACLDQVEGLGDFLELEILVSKEEHREMALSIMEQVLADLGYAMEDTTRISYLSMLQKKTIL